MKITQTKDWTYSDICTQKDIENYLLTHFCIPRALFKRELKNAREHKYYWFSIAACGKVIAVDTLPRKMSLFYCDADEWKNTITVRI